MRARRSSRGSQRTRSAINGRTISLLKNTRLHEDLNRTLIGSINGRTMTLTNSSKLNIIITILLTLNSRLLRTDNLLLNRISRLTNIHVALGRLSNMVTIFINKGTHQRIILSIVRGILSKKIRLILQRLTLKDDKLLSLLRRLLSALILGNQSRRSQTTRLLKRLIHISLITILLSRINRIRNSSRKRTNLSGLGHRMRITLRINNVSRLSSGVKLTTRRMVTQTLLLKTMKKGQMSTERIHSNGILIT